MIWLESVNSHFAKAGNFRYASENYVILADSVYNFFKSSKLPLSPDSVVTYAGVMPIVVCPVVFFTLPTDFPINRFKLLFAAFFLAELMIGGFSFTWFFILEEFAFPGLDSFKLKELDFPGALATDEGLKSILLNARSEFCKLFVSSQIVRCLTVVFGDLVLFFLAVVVCTCLDTKRMTGMGFQEFVASLAIVSMFGFMCWLLCGTDYDRVVLSLQAYSEDYGTRHEGKYGLRFYIECVKIIVNSELAIMSIFIPFFLYIFAVNYVHFKTRLTFGIFLKFFCLVDVSALTFIWLFCLLLNPDTALDFYLLDLNPFDHPFDFDIDPGNPLTRLLVALVLWLWCTCVIFIIVFPYKKK